MVHDSNIYRTTVRAVDVVNDDDTIHNRCRKTRMVVDRDMTVVFRRFVLDGDDTVVFQ
jgi:hypothetical protein